MATFTNSTLTNSTFTNSTFTNSTLTNSTLDISAVIADSKRIEYVVTTFDPVYNDLVKTIEIVKKFIIDHGLIIYGGSAIDYALRLKGDKIYPDDMLAVPDLDFYSPNNVEHAYKLADALFAIGYKDVRAINAQHMETMRVDVMRNHFIADITYRPPEIFDKLPYLEYNGMKIIHPDFQRIDVHSSLSFPYDNPPREVIFDRWSKDITRFNKLAAVYPISQHTPIKAKPMQFKLYRACVLTGFAAYAVIYTKFMEELKKVDVTVQELIAARASFSNGVLTFDTINNICEFVHYKLEKVVGELGMSAKYYEPYVNMMPARAEDKNSNLIIYSTKHRLVSVNSVDVDGGHFRITNIQYLLKHFLSMHFVKKDSPKLAATYLAYYNSLIKMCQIAESAGLTESITYPSVIPYGNENINLAREIALNQMYVEIGKSEPYKTPQNYYPQRAEERCAAGKPANHPAFNPEDIKFFREMGREVSDFNEL
jgi:hypothetical protein